MKDVIDKLPTIQARENNFGKLISNLTKQGLKANEEERTILDNKVKIIEMLRNKEQLMAIKKLVKDRTIQNFSRDDMSRLLEKGLSTHESDEKALEDSIDKLKDAITADSKTVEDFIQEVNNKAKEMKPSSKVKESNSEQVDGNNITK
ncbi:hypothetical protein [Wolbachia endosymbiont of Spodoptera picta]|uniref:hypothetical protein n=1 Tax=Wolbachia endosymbiont of Spodoptera picta TaxID=2769078 RepID=UPI001FE296CB|nr:hypothetical protein [Wolbachia endosymbiont of Spodoptera picta]